MKRGPALLLFPILGSGLALLFRTSETDWRSLQPASRPAVRRQVVSLPGGRGVRFIGVPGIGGETAFYLSETEMPPARWRRFSERAPSHALAREYCAWMSEQTGRRIRLPTAAEWRLAARAGVPAAEFPWGFGPPVPPRGLRFALDRPPRTPGPAYGYGFRDLAGGHWEWTSEGLLLGGAWSERNPDLLRIDHAWDPLDGYAGWDTAIRLLLEP